MHGPVRGSDGAYYLILILPMAWWSRVIKRAGPLYGSAGGFLPVGIFSRPTGQLSTWRKWYAVASTNGTAPDGTNMVFIDNQWIHGHLKIFYPWERRFLWPSSQALVDLPGKWPMIRPEILMGKCTKIKRFCRPLLLAPQSCGKFTEGNTVVRNTKQKW